jgi:UDPglucose--hexose-1-phosphate uridylyltransferase
VPELRADPLTGELVLLAPGRAARPHTAPARPAPAAPARCPFCPGHEDDTPPEVTRVGEGGPDQRGWRLRVVPNLYPIVGGPDAAAGATGVHEVVVFSPDHHRSFGRLDDDDAVAALTMLRDRSRALGAGQHAYVQVAVNEGRAAGASIAHPHAQVIALDFVPPAVDAALARFAAADADLVLADQGRAADADGLVVTRAGAPAWCAPASSSAYEVRVAAPGAGARFQAASDGEVESVAITLRDVLAALDAVLDGPPYNVVLHDAPTVGEPPYHWWMRVLPRVAVAAGFELGTGVLVETVDPPVAAAALRAALDDGRVGPAG